ncbi:MAG: polynucleotide adenylyltransferase PcnB [Deferrisomatales bacterium]
MEDTSTPLPVVVPRRDHAISRKQIDTDALWILNRLRREGYLAYLVGGAVRDLLLGHEPKDFDVGTDARPSEVKRIFRNSRLIGRRFRLAHVYFRRKGEPDKIVEVSTFRSLAKPAEPDGAEIPPEDLDLTGNVFGSPAEDAWRRDFTVNALFYNIDDFSVVDHVGGLTDLKDGIIRIIGDPDERFQEDPVRMLRAVEFAVRLGFRIDEATENGIRRNGAEIAQASPARLRDELRQLEQRGIVAGALAEAHRLDFLAPLLPELKVIDGVFPLIELLDARAAAGEPASEASYLAALLLPTVAARCPLAPGASLEEALEAIAEPAEALTQRYQISAHIRHTARELLLSCYRIARGKGYRAKGKFVRKAEFAEAWTFFRTWSGVTGELGSVVEYWEAYLSGQAVPEGGAKARKRRRPRRRGPRRAGAPAGTAAE